MTDICIPCVIGRLFDDMLTDKGLTDVVPVTIKLPYKEGYCSLHTPEAARLTCGCNQPDCPYDVPNLKQ